MANLIFNFTFPSSLSSESQTQISKTKAPTGLYTQSNSALWDLFMKWMKLLGEAFPLFVRRQGFFTYFYFAPEDLGRDSRLWLMPRLQIYFLIYCIVKLYLMASWTSEKLLCYKLCIISAANPGRILYSDDTRSTLLSPSTLLCCYNRETKQ